MLSLPISFQEATKILLKDLPSRRMRDVVERRFGLKGGRRHTLEAIGKEYKITRERVRQIEADALKHLHKSGSTASLASLFQALESHLREHGAVMAEHHFLNSVGDAKTHPHVGLLLEVGSAFRRAPETDQCHARWALDPEAAARAEKIIFGVVNDLNVSKRPVAEAELYAMIARNAKGITGAESHRRALDAYLATHKHIRKNPYGEYGLRSWSAVNPRGVRDKAHMVLVKAGKPMHFREVAQAISGAGWSARKAHPQTVHNELIKDPRFVLVGRGLYALQEWGYESGAVKDVMVAVLKQARHPLSKDELVQRVLEKRLVKAPTIFLNLQNKSLFKRTEEGKYTLV